MSLPFSEQDFLAVFGAFNEMLWPAVLISWALAIALLVGLVRGRARPAAVLTLVAFLWAWSGMMYHAAFFTTINPAGWIFAALFVLEAAGLALLIVSGRPPTFVLGQTLRGKIAAGLLAYAILYPILVWLSGAEFPRAPVFAVPCPTVLLTAGVLLAARPAVPRWLYVAPVLWAMIGGSAAFLLGVTPDLMLLVAAGALVVDGLAAARPARAESPA